MKWDILDNKFPIRKDHQTNISKQMYRKHPELNETRASGFGASKLKLRHGPSLSPFASHFCCPGGSELNQAMASEHSGLYDRQFDQDLFERLHGHRHSEVDAFLLLFYPPLTLFSSYPCSVFFFLH